ncbi:MAG: type I glyceraldehyde-3-phosphate dehydrogenase [Alphaproteobacteria bacterium]|nr:type I glyceraldehyde-3-phosphate dehydrogenase [Alphaproteobacteria bacterium]
MTKTKVAINGFGRIGRLVFRALLESDRTDIEVVGINDLAPADMNAHLLTWDSVHGKLPFDITLDGDLMKVKDQNVKMCSERNPEDLPWGDLDVDIVFECTGIFLKKEMASKHIQAGAKKVIVSAPSPDADLTVVYGINHDKITADMDVISNASCTTNCLAPVAYVLDKEFGISHGFMTTIHAFTGDQRTVDTAHKDPYRARAASVSMIPTSTGAAKAVGLVLPHLNGKLDGVAIRVPTADVSLVDLKCVLNKEVTAEQINAAIKKYAEGELKGVLGYNELPLVSVDYTTNPNSSTFDAPGTKVMQDGFVRVMTWYDNEWGFSNRMLDTAAAFAKTFKS